MPDFFSFWILWHNNTFLHHTISTLLAGGKSGKSYFLFFDPERSKVISRFWAKKWFHSDRISDYIAFGEDRSLLTWLEPELCPLEDKMLSRIPWPKMTSISDPRGHNGLKVVLWGLLARGSVAAQFERNQKESILFLIDLTWNDPKATSMKLGTYYYIYILLQNSDHFRQN